LEDKGQNVLIVAIDEESLIKIGPWPWPRSRLAELIGRIKQGRPKVIGIDLLLDKPSRGENAGQEDERLSAILRAPPVAVLPIVAVEDDIRSSEEILFEPLNTFLTDHTRVGVANISYDPIDKTARESRLIYNETYLSYPLAICREYFGLSTEDIKVKDPFIRFGKYSIPVRNSHSLINYKCAKIGQFSARDVMEPFFDPAFFFEGKVVLLGRTDLASKDFMNTTVPSGRIFETLPMAGVEIWKEIIDMILGGSFLYRISPLFLFGIMLALTISISSVTSYSNKNGAAFLIFTLLLLIFLFHFLFQNQNLVLPVIHIAALCILTFSFTFLHNYSIYLKEKNMITAAFKSYVSDRILKDILSKKVDLKVGGKRKKLTILFADIKGFTNFADTQEPEKVLDLLKIFFSRMNKVIIDHNGIIDKLMGDSILAFFGDFVDTDEHAVDAVKAAIEMQRKAPEVREQLGFDLTIRIGIHTGDVTIGNIGSYEHLDYTVIGKNVNLAKRLESACDPGKILISDSTYEMIRDKIDVADLREVSLKGFTLPVKVCSVLGLRDST